LHKPQLNLYGILTPGSIYHMKIDPRVNIPWGSKYHMTPVLHFLMYTMYFFLKFENFSYISYATL